MGKWPDFEYHGGKLLKYDRPLATIGDMPENGHFGHFQAFSGMSPKVTKGRQGSRGTPGMGEMS